MKTFYSLSDIISITYHLLTESKVITGESQTDAGLDELTNRQRGQYIKAKVWDVSLMTKQTRVITFFS